MASRSEGKGRTDLGVKVENGNTLRIGDVTIQFIRTLRIPDDNKTYPLPPGLGSFPIRRVSDYADKVPESWRRHGGVFLPMFQREAMWLQFGGRHWKPNAMKLAVGKVCALTGKPWSEELHEKPQDYLVVPSQPWLDGINSGTSTISQFIAMPLGMGYTVEGQVTGEEKHGGLQICVFEPKAGVFPDHPPRSFFGFGGAYGAGFGGSPFGSTAPEGGSPFGSTAPAGGSLFGGPAPAGGSLFGGPAPAGGALFGGVTPAGGALFGGAAPAGGSLFGGAAPAGGSLFGGAAPAFGSGFAFGSSASAFGFSASAFGSSASAFGSSASGFSSSVPASGSSVPAFGSSSPAFGSATPAFSSAAPAFGPSATSAFGSATPAFGSATPAFGSAAPAFGSAASAFGSAAPAFGSAAPAFGSSTVASFPTASGFGFGSAQSANGAAFGITPASAFGPRRTEVHETSASFGEVPGASTRPPKVQVGGMEMGLGAGGRMRQEIYADTHGLQVWDQSTFSRVFVHLCNSAMWRDITGEAPPESPGSAKTYASYGFPWYDLYDEGREGVDASPTLAAVKTVKEMDQAKGFGPQQDDSSVPVPCWNVQTSLPPPFAKKLTVDDGEW